MVKETSREMIASVHNISSRQPGYFDEVKEAQEHSLLSRLGEANREAISAIARSNSRNSLIKVSQKIINSQRDQQIKNCEIKNSARSFQSFQDDKGDLSSQVTHDYAENQSQFEDYKICNQK